MREFLQDAHKHQDDGLGRAQAPGNPNLPKRLYEKAEAVPAEGGFAIALDGRLVKTPGRVPVTVPSEALAHEMAAEWAAQKDVIRADTMPLTRLVNSGIEGGEKVVPALREEVLKYASNDLLLYRAESPQELVAEQEAVWDAVLVTLARHFNVRFQPTIGIIHQAQPEDTLTRLAEAIHDAPLLALTSLVSITGLTGSGLLAISLRHKLCTADDAWTAAHVDEDYNIRLWGEDDEAKARRTQRRSEYDAALKVLAHIEG